MKPVTLLCLSLSLVSSAVAAAPGEVLVKQGVYQPFFRENGEEDQAVGPMWVDRDPVTNEQFARFLKQNPDWTRSRIPKLFSSETYLQHWTSDETYDLKMAKWPVTNVTWFAARKYCESQGKRLMTIREWEYASDAQSKENLDLILNWYAQSNALGPVGRGKTNAFGLRGMHGLIWEWVEDYSSAIIAGDSRDSNDTNAKLFCGSGSLKAKDPSQYATFMRFAFRSSLKARYAGGALGFRCAKDGEGAERSR